MKAEKKKQWPHSRSHARRLKPIFTMFVSKTCAPPLKVRISPRRQRLTGALQITMVGGLFPKDSAGWSLGMRKEGCA